MKDCFGEDVFQQVFHKVSTQQQQQEQQHNHNNVFPSHLMVISSSTSFLHLFQPIICSGITVGSDKAVYDYVDLMASTMTTAEFAKCERNGVDQGVHNVLLHTERVKKDVVRQFDQRTGPVANMQAHVMKLKENMEVVNDKKEKVAIMHQYD